MELAGIALKFFGTKYTWGGNSPEDGMDCSGLVLEAMRSIGIVGSKDMRAVDIYKTLLSKNSLSCEPSKNAVLFFGKNVDSITHVAIALSDKLMVEAGGEGSKATTNGYVRIRPISNRSDLVASLTV